MYLWITQIFFCISVRLLNILRLHHWTSSIFWTLWPIWGVSQSVELNHQSSSEAVAARRNRRQLERRYWRTHSKAARQSLSAACQNTNGLITESRRQIYVNKLSATDDNSHQRLQVIGDIAIILRIYISNRRTRRCIPPRQPCLYKVVSDLLSVVDGGEPSPLLSLDISAAFDTLDHHHLLSHAHELFGFSDSVLKWMQSYL